MAAISSIAQGASSLVKSLFGGPLKGLGGGIVKGASAINKSGKLAGNEALRGRYLSSLKNKSFNNTNNNTNSNSNNSNNVNIKSFAKDVLSNAVKIDENVIDDIEMGFNKTKDEINNETKDES